MASDQRRLGEATVPAIGQGTWNMEADDRAECIRALRRGIDLGLTHLDTAELYGDGEVEERVGEAVKGLRERIFLASKVKPSNASRRGTIEACERSLRRLGTDRLELYLLHWPGPHPLEDTIEAFEQLVREGKIRTYGVSNFDVDELEQAVRIAGEGRIACNQVLYHLRERHIEAELVPWCVQRRIAVGSSFADTTATGTLGYCARRYIRPEKPRAPGIDRSSSTRSNSPPCSRSATTSSKLPASAASTRSDSPETASRRAPRNSG